MNGRIHHCSRKERKTVAGMKNGKTRLGNIQLLLAGRKTSWACWAKNDSNRKGKNVQGCRKTNHLRDQEPPLGGIKILGEIKGRHLGGGGERRLRFEKLKRGGKQDNLSW